MSVHCRLLLRCWFAFLVLLISDEDKTTDRSIRFWFEVMDLDGDGCIRYHEMLRFYEEQSTRLQALNQEVFPFSSILFQMYDRETHNESIGDLM